MFLYKGINLHNPGNIQKGENFLGEITPSAHPRWAQFVDDAHGYRAMFKDITSKIKAGTNTIRKIITKYAPPKENNTALYINNMTLWTSIPADKILTVNDSNLLINLVAAISRQENGKQAVMSDVLKGFDLQTTLKKK